MSCTRYACMASLRRRLMAGEVVPWLERHHRKSYIKAAVLASPPWVDRKVMRELAKEVRRRNANGQHVVLDHIVPLNHRYVCGLNVPWNLRIVPWGHNARKSNRWCDGQGELFSGPEQLRLFVGGG